MNETGYLQETYINSFNLNKQLLPSSAQVMKMVSSGFSNSTINFNTHELKLLIISVLIVTFAFAFDDGRSNFSTIHWLLNFLKTFVVVLVAFLIHQIGHKWMAQRYGATTEYRTWGIQRYGFAKRTKCPMRFNFFGKGYVLTYIPLGLLLSFFVTLLSLGKGYFLSVERFEIFEEPLRRVGRSFKNIGGYETGIIALGGPLANIFFAAVLQTFSPTFFREVILINALIALFSFIPFSDLDGAKIFFGSNFLYIFGFSFSVVFFVLSFFAGGITSVLLSGSFSVVIVALSMYWRFS